MSEPWTVLGTEYLQRSPWRDVRVDRVRIHTGDEITYTYLEAPSAVYVVPLTVDGRIAMIRQYRHPVRDWAWEVPAGSTGGEPAEVTARKELAEEIGGRCRGLAYLGWVYPETAHVGAKTHVFLALDVELGPTSLEPTELIELVLLAPEDAFARARTGRINDGQSALALLMAEPLIRAHLEE